jgi:hypothetical protein
MGFWRMRWVWGRYVVFSHHHHQSFRRKGDNEELRLERRGTGAHINEGEKHKRKTNMSEGGEELTPRQSNQYPS